MAGFGSGAVRVVLAVASVAWLAGFAPAGPGAGASPAEPADGVTYRLSKRSDGGQANGNSHSASISAGGRYVAFESSATNLVDKDTNRHSDVFVRDRVALKTRRVSIGPGGEQGNHNSREPSISGDGRYVAFVSIASDLVRGDTNGWTDVFVRDRVAKVTRRVSVGAGGGQGNGPSFSPSISSDGRYVAFYSYASDLVAGDTNETSDVFVRDRVAKVTTLVSVGQGLPDPTNDTWNPTISSDGRYVAYESYRSDLVTGDNNDKGDVFVWDRETRVTQRVSLGPGGAEANSVSDDPTISSDGRYVAYSSHATNLVAAGDTNGYRDLYLWDRESQATRRVSVGLGGAEANAPSYNPSFSGRGRYLAFSSWASNLVAGDTNDSVEVFVWDQVAQTFRRVSIGRGGAEANGQTGNPSFSRDGRYVAFWASSFTTNLVARDTNRMGDVFVRHLFN